jgi:periplasmic divalent cation tolerance protein
VQRDAEWLLIAKSRWEALPDLVRRVQVLHSYEVPEIIAVPVVGGSEVYLEWLGEQAHGTQHSPG